MQHLLDENKKLAKQVELLENKYKICLQAFDALQYCDYSGIVVQALKEIEKLDE